jgi:hypothetical protein
MTIADIRPALTAYVVADASISGVIGTRQDARMFPVVLPQGEKRPSVVYSRISGLSDHHMQGPSGLSRPRIQIDCWAAKADIAATLSDLVKARIDGFKGDIPYGGDSPQASVTVQGIFFDSEREDFDNESKLYRASRDYFIWFAER